MSERERIEAAPKLVDELKDFVLASRDAFQSRAEWDATISAVFTAARDTLLRAEPVGEPEIVREARGYVIQLPVGRKLCKLDVRMIRTLAEWAASQEPVGEPVAWRLEDQTADGKWHTAGFTDSAEKILRWTEGRVHSRAIPLYASPPAAPEAQEPYDRQGLVQEEWDDSVEQIHRELAGEVPLPEAQEPEP